MKRNGSKIYSLVGKFAERAKLDKLHVIGLLYIIVVNDCIECRSQENIVCICKGQCLKS